MNQRHPPAPQSSVSRHTPQGGSGKTDTERKVAARAKGEGLGVTLTGGAGGLGWAVAHSPPGVVPAGASRYG